MSLLQSMFTLEPSVIEKVLRAILVYVFLIIGLRLAGKRELAQMNPFDLVVLLTLSNTVQNAIIGRDDSVTGGIIGALTQAGVSEEDAHVYAEGVRRGGTLVTARVDDRNAAQLEATLDGSALRTTDLRSTYAKSGWKTFDPAAKPYSADEVRRERALYQ